MSNYLWNTAQLNDTLEDLSIRGAEITLKESTAKSHLDLPIMLLDGRIQQALAFDARQPKMVDAVVREIVKLESLDNIAVVFPTCHNSIWYMVFSYLENRRWSFSRAPLIGDLGVGLTLGVFETVLMSKNPFQMGLLNQLGLLT